MAAMNTTAHRFDSRSFKCVHCGLDARTGIASSWFLAPQISEAEMARLSQCSPAAAAELERLTKKAAEPLL